MAVDVSLESLRPIDRVKAAMWCVDRYGPTSEGKWELCNLAYIRFKRDRDATWFLLTWLR